MFQIPDTIDVVLLGIVVLAALGLAHQIRKLRATWRESRQPILVQHNLDTGAAVPVMQTEGGKLFAEISQDICPDCGGRGFYAGPRGGMSQNIYCRNRACRSAFNVTQFNGSEGTVERIGKQTPEWYVGAAI